MKDIEITLQDKNIKPNVDIIGTITVNYTGKYDSIVLNTQIQIGRAHV